MQLQKITHFSFLWLFVTFFWIYSNGHAATVEETNFGEDRWIKPDETLIIKLSPTHTRDDGQLRLIIGQTDVTHLIRMTDNTLTYEPRFIKLPAGKTEVVLYLVKDREDWQEISRMPLQVLSRLGFSRAELTPQVNVNLKSQLDEHRSKDAGPEDRSTPFTDLSVQGGFSTSHEKNDFNVQTKVNLLGSTFRGETLRFFEKNDNAPKLDLSDYLIQANKGNAYFNFGHISFGNHRHLVNNIGSRGGMIKYNFLDRFDLNFASAYGRTIVGWDNPTGFNDLHNSNITTGFIGAEIFKDSPGKLRLETAYMTGSLKPETGFNVGEVVDSEKSRGYSFRIASNTFENRLRADLSYARSTFDNNEDPQLSGSFDVVPVEKTTDEAYYAELAYDLIRNLEIWGERTFSLTLTGRHEKTEPLYRSLGAFVTPDQLFSEIASEAFIGDVGLRFHYSWTEDNLDDIPTILKTKTKNTGSDLNIPLSSYFQQYSYAKWIPVNLGYGVNRIHQFGDNKPLFEDSGFEDSSIPDQVTTSHYVTSQWSIEKWTFGYQFNYSFQDNRQPGREKADFKNTTHSIILGFQPLDVLNFNIGLSETDAENKEIRLTSTTRNFTFSTSWNFWTNWLISGNFSFTDSLDSERQAKGDAYTTELQLTRQYLLPALWGKSLPGSAFLRYNINSNRASDNVFDFSSDVRVSTISCGINFSY